MKSLLAIVILSLLMGLPFGLALAKETTALDEKLDGTKAHIRVFIDEEHNNVCYYRRHGGGIACLPLDKQETRDKWKTIK